MHSIDGPFCAFVLLHLALRNYISQTFCQQDSLLWRMQRDKQEEEAAARDLVLVSEDP